LLPRFTVGFYHLTFTGLLVVHTTTRSVVAFTTCLVYLLRFHTAFWLRLFVLVHLFVTVTTRLGSGLFTTVYRLFTVPRSGLF